MSAVSPLALPQSAPTQTGRLDWPLVAAWAGLVALLAVNLPAFLCMGLDSDILMYDLCARRVLAGDVHYRDLLETNFPGIVWLHMIFRSVVGWSFEALRGGGRGHRCRVGLAADPVAAARLAGLDAGVRRHRPLRLLPDPVRVVPLPARRVDASAGAGGAGAPPPAGRTDCCGPTRGFWGAWAGRRWRGAGRRPAGSSRSSPSPR